MRTKGSWKLRVGLVGVLILFCRVLSAQEGFGFAPITLLSMDTHDPSTLYAVARVHGPRLFRGFHGALVSTVVDELFRSQDGGSTWQPITTPTVDTQGNFFFVSALVVDPQIPGTLYAAAGGQFQDVGLIEVAAVFKSADQGQTWAKVYDESNDPSSIVIDHGTSSTVYLGAFSAATPVGVFKTLDGGADWLDVSPPGFDACKVLGIDPSKASVLYAGGCITPLFRSTDAGASWTAIGDGLSTDDAPLTSFAIAPSRPTTIYAGTSFSGVLRSFDSGEHWVSAASGMGSAVNLLALAVDPRSFSLVYAGTGAGFPGALAGLFKTSNAGASWEPIGFENVSVNSIVIDPSSPDTLYVGTSVGAFKSTDAGASWLPIEMGLPLAGGILSVPPTQAVTVHGRSR